MSRPFGSTTSGLLPSTNSHSFAVVSETVVNTSAPCGRGLLEQVLRLREVLVGLLVGLHLPSADYVVQVLPSGLRYGLPRTVECVVKTVGILDLADLRWRSAVPVSHSWK